MALADRATLRQIALLFDEQRQGQDRSVIAGLLAALLVRPAWHARAACADEPTATFFPERHDSQTLQRARTICASCPVAPLCLDQALDAGASLQGIWSSTSSRQRSKLRAEREAAA